MSFEEQLEEIARDGARNLMLRNAAAVKGSMGADGDPVRYEWIASPHGPLERPGRLEVKGPTELIEKFMDLLRKRMGQ